jgi:hypothetical protein
VRESYDSPLETGFKGQEVEIDNKGHSVYVRTGGTTDKYGNIYRAFLIIYLTC